MNNIKWIINKLESGFLWFWIKQYKVSFLLVLLMVLLWIASFAMIDKKSAPDLDLWMISISKAYIWVNPEDIDSLITDKIEKKIKDIAGIKKISSTSSLGFSNIIVELDNGVNVQDTMTEVKDGIDTINFPNEALDTVVQDISSKDNRLFSIVFYADENIYSKDYLLDKVILLKDKLEGTKWINKIDVQWGEDYEIRVLINKSKLEKLWLTIWWISNTIKNHNQNTPIWNYSIWNFNYDFRFEWEIRTLKEFLNIPIILNNWSIVYLKDISTVNKFYKNDSISKAFIWSKWGFNSLTLDIKKSDNEDFFSSSELAKEKLLNEIIGIHYEWIKYEVNLDASKEMLQSYTDLFQNMLTTFGLVFLTLLVFIWFKEWFIGILIVPLSYFITFIVLYYWGFSLNFLTNFSLILSLWVAIDTIIVVIEWANKKVKLWYTPRHAILVAIREYAPPIISGTMTTLAAFIPLLTLPWVMWKYLSFIPITVFITLLASLFLSLTVTSAIFMKLTKNKNYYRVNEQEESTISESERELLEYDRKDKIEKHWELSNIRENIFDKISNFYVSILTKVIKTGFSRLLVIFLPIFLLLVSFWFWNWFTLFPVSDNIQINVKIEATQWKKTESLKDNIPLLENALWAIPEIKLFTMNLENNVISVIIELYSKDERAEQWLRDSFKVENNINEQLDLFKTLWYTVESWVLAGGPPWGKAVWIKLIADNTDYLSVLSTVSEDFDGYLKSLEGTKNVTTSTSKTPGQFVFKLNYEKIAYLGLTPWEITNLIFANTNWLISGTVKWLLDDHDIKVKIAEFKDNLSPYDVENLVLNTSKGKVRLVDVAAYEFNTAISDIKRVDTKITTVVDSDLNDWVVQTAIQPKLIEFAEKYDFPVWISYTSWWEAEENADLIQWTLTAFVIALFLIFIILVLQFNSYGQPAIILYSVVLALLWVNTWLWIMWLPYSMAFAIWFIALTWIVINNAIIYIDKINTNLREWLVDSQAILQAGKSRLIPMLVTTITTVFGILPIALQDQFWAGLWFTIVFGLVTGTIMTLFVIPALYYQVFLHKKWWLWMIYSLVLTILIFIIFNLIKWLFI